MRIVYSLNRYGFNNRYVRRQAQCVCLTELCLGLQANLVVGAASRPFVLSVSVTLPVGFAAFASARCSAESHKQRAGTPSDNHASEQNSQLKCGIHMREFPTLSVGFKEKAQVRTGDMGDGRQEQKQRI